MAKKKTSPLAKPSQPLRERAERMLRMSPTDVSSMAAEDMQRLMHEVQVHQIELELQNQELREAQLHLAESRDRYSDLYEFAPVGYVTLNRDGKILEANLTAATLLGVERRALVQAHLVNFMTRESADACYLHLQDVFASRPTWESPKTELPAAKKTCEVEVQQASGSVMAVRLESIGFGLASEHHCLTALLDISARKLAEEALRKLNIDLGHSLADRTTELQERIDDLKLLTEAVANLGEGVVITDDELNWPDPRIRFVNAALCRITGYSAEELIGQTPRMLQGQQTDQAAMNWLGSELSAGRSFRVEETNYRKDGTPYLAELFVTPLFDAAGQRMNFIAIHRDITERKELERQLVETVADERRRLGHELHDGIGQELTGLSLTAGTIRELLRRCEGLSSAEVPGSPDGGAMFQQACAALDCLRKGLNTTNRHVQSLSRGILPVPIDSEGLRAALDDLAASIHQPEEIVCRLDCPATVNIADNSIATHLFHIAQEAVHNAVKHAQARLIRITLRVADGTLILEVSDNGLGLRPPNSSATNSSGAGLRIMQHRASLIGATFHIDPAAEGGTVVRCCLPLANHP